MLNEQIQQTNFDSIVPTQRLDMISEAIESQWKNPLEPIPSSIQASFSTGALQYLIIGKDNIDLLDAELKFHITPKPKDTLETVRKIVDILTPEDEVREGELPFCFKVALADNAYGEGKESNQTNPPRIVIYPNYSGKYSDEEKLKRAAEVFSILQMSLKDTARDENYQPRYSVDVALHKKISPISLAQGSGMDKYLSPTYRQQYPDELGNVLDMRMFQGGLYEFELMVRDFLKLGNTDLSFSTKDNSKSKPKRVDSWATGRLHEVEQQFFQIRESTTRIIEDTTKGKATIPQLTAEFKQIATSLSTLPDDYYYGISRMIQERLEETLATLTEKHIPAAETSTQGIELDEFMESFAAFASQDIIQPRNIFALILKDPFFKTHYAKYKDEILELIKTLLETESKFSTSPSSTIYYSNADPDSDQNFLSLINTDLLSSVNR